MNSNVLEISMYVGAVTASLLWWKLCSENYIGGKDIDSRYDVELAEGTSEKDREQSPRFKHILDMYF